MADIPFDAVKLIADIRAGDGEAMAQAYRATFGGDLGRLVLAHHLQECGVGNALGDENLKYRAGRHDGALLLASKAGFDAVSIAVAVMTDQLEGNTDERSIDSGPGQQWGDSDPEHLEF
jgi:hypothetical protein